MKDRLKALKQELDAQSPLSLVLMAGGRAVYPGCGCMFLFKGKILEAWPCEPECSVAEDATGLALELEIADAVRWPPL